MSTTNTNQRISYPLIARYCELPWVASTSLDWYLRRHTTDSTLQRHRIDIRKRFGLEENVDWMQRQSLGRLGTFQIVPSSLLLFLLTDMRGAESAYKTRLADSIVKAGLPEFLRSQSFATLSEFAVEAVRKTVLDKKPVGASAEISRLVNVTIADLIRDDRRLAPLVANYSDMMDCVVADLPEVKRQTGYVVRVEESETLVAMNSAEGTEFRWVPSMLLDQFGLDKADAPFVMTEQSWAPDMTVCFYQPAALESGLTVDELASINERVNEREVPARDAVVPVY